MGGLGELTDWIQGIGGPGRQSGQSRAVGGARTEVRQAQAWGQGDLGGGSQNGGAAGSGLEAGELEGGQVQGELWWGRHSYG